MLMGDILKVRQIHLERLIKITNHSKKKQRHIRELESFNRSFGSLIEGWVIGGGHQ